MRSREEARASSLKSERSRMRSLAGAGGSNTCDVFVSLGLDEVVGVREYHFLRQIGQMFLFGLELLSQA